jgi:hypothetical protein
MLLTALLLAPLAALHAADTSQMAGKPNVITDESGATLRTLQTGWGKPARTYKPHTRWWWPGNALTKADITWQLEQMAAQGIGGVEIMSAWRMYEKGNVDYLSPEFMELVKHAVAESKRLDIEVAITFSPGWSFGGPWVPKEDQSKVLCIGSIDLQGGTTFNGKLPGLQTKPAGGKGKNAEHTVASEPGSLVAVVAAKVSGKNQLDAASLTVLTDRAKPGSDTIEWNAPPGQWRLMAFWLKYTGQECQAQSMNPPAMVVDHLNQGAVQRYCDYLGGALARAVGDEFGKTVDSFFCDSFEIHPLPNSLLWSTDTLAGFQKHNGYDLTPYLPALWYEIGPLTPRVRYDLGDYLSRLGLQTVFKTFNDWCDAHHVQARIQPHYRFTEELIQGAGATARPETEVTTARFEPVADPRKATASGARFYGRDIVSAESYTFIHPARYRTDLADLKMATDAFLRDGITQFYNHGYFASPELHVAPNRDMPWANRISHWNTWWKYYHHVAEYVARSCYLLRQGKLVADVLIYSPQATAWSERALWESERRVLPYGNLAKTLVANGYDFDVVNDDLLQHRTQFRDGGVAINDYQYRLLILPRATVVPIETMRALKKFADAGGTIVALEQLPSASAGLKDWEKHDGELKQFAGEIFGTNPAGKSRSIFLADYKLDQKPFNPGRQPYTVTPPLTAPQRQLLAALERVTPPDFTLAGRAQSDGLTFIHKRTGDVDVYFVSNLEPTRIATEVTFRVTGKTLQRWDAITGQVSPTSDFRADANGSTLALEFEPWESAFFVFAPGAAPTKPAKPAAVANLPEPLPVTGTWQMKLEGFDFETFETSTTALTSWTDSPRTRHFSGTGRYEIEFDLPAARLVNGSRMILDLGKVGNIAEVELNGQTVGVAWMAPHKIDITRAARAGKNKLMVRVTNTLINYVSGLKAPPEVPVELQAQLGKANPAIYPQSRLARREMSETDLPPSGLLGPVTILWKNPSDAK